MGTPDAFNVSDEESLKLETTLADSVRQGQPVIVILDEFEATKEGLLRGDFSDRFFDRLRSWGGRVLSPWSLLPQLIYTSWRLGPL